MTDNAPLIEQLSNFEQVVQRHQQQMKIRHIFVPWVAMFGVGMMGAALSGFIDGFFGDSPPRAIILSIWVILLITLPMTAYHFYDKRIDRARLREVKRISRATQRLRRQMEVEAMDDLTLQTTLNELQSKFENNKS